METRANLLKILKDLVEFSSDWLMYRGLSGEIIFLSPAVWEITGYSRIEFFKQPNLFREILHPEDRENILQAYSNELRNPLPCRKEFRILRKDGAVRWISHHCRPVFDKRGEIVGRVSNNRDITSEKKMEQRLINHEETLRALINASPDIICFKDGQGRWLEANQADLELFQLENIDYTGKTDRQLSGLSPFYRDAFLTCEKSDEMAWEKGTISRCAEFIPKPDGTQKVYDIIKVPLFQKDGSRKGLVVLGRDITDIKKTEEALQRSKLRYKTILKALPDLIFIVNNQLRFTDCYAPATSPHLTDCKKIVGKNARAILPEELFLLTKKFVYETLKTGQIQIFVSNIKISGKTYWYETRMVPVEKQRDEVLAIVRDITKRKWAEIALQESEHRYRRLFENSIDAIFINTLDGKFIDINPAGLKFFGFSSFEEIKDTNIINFYKNPKDREKFLNTLRSNGFVKNYELTLKRPDGMEYFIQSTASIIYGERHRPLAIQGIIRDVTEQKAQEEKIRRLATVIEQSEQAVIITDLQGHITYVNPAFERTTGYKSAEVIGENPRILQSGKQDSRFYKTLWDRLTAGQSWQGIFHNKKKDGSLFYERAVIFPIKDHRGKIINFAAVKQDITEEKVLEEQLLHAQKMESLGVLTGGIAHDFNNLLSIIKGYSELGLHRLSENSTGYNELSTILKAANKAENLVNQLLAFSRKQVIDPRAVSINEIISNMNKMLRRLIGENIHIETHLASGIPSIMADPGQIEQILVNLVVNARDAILEQSNKHPEKRVTIETGYRRIDKTHAETRWKIRKGDYVILSISDTGKGMSEEVLHKIFDPFFTTKEVGKGTGLGLSTVFGIVKQNKGFIHVYSEPYNGTTFNIYWPASEKNVSTKKKNPPEDLILKGKGGILFVEDQPELREMVTQALRDMGYSVTEAENGEKALCLLKEGHHFDLLITDLVMPKMNGDELAKEARRIYPELKIIFTSGYTDSHLIHNGILKNGINFLHKPFTLSNLSKIIRETLSGPIENN